MGGCAIASHRKKHRLKKNKTSIEIKSMKNNIIFHGDLEEITKSNTDYQRVLFTGSQLQLVVMTLKPGESIPMEVHHDHDQFIRVDKGRGMVMIAKKSGQVPSKYELKNGMAVVIPAGVYHEVINTSKRANLHLYSVYAPPEHAKDFVRRRMPR